MGMVTPHGVPTKATSGVPQVAASEHTTHIRNGSYSTGILALFLCETLVDSVKNTIISEIYIK
jgi:hypothetical protein